MTDANRIKELDAHIAALWARVELIQVEQHQLSKLLQAHCRGEYYKEHAP
jgi:hypothetical protein